jgi:hypothetical protein
MNISINFINILNKKYRLILRHLQFDNTQFNTTNNENFQKQQLRDLYIYIGVLIGLILVILGSYSLYRKCVEKKATEEIEREYQLLMNNLFNSYTSRISSSQSDRRPQSCNIMNQNHIPSINNDLSSNRADLTHEERMENIRKKFGNSILIKCLLKKQIEQIQYNKNFCEEFGDKCTICMDNFVANILISKTPCEHIFHKNCFDRYLKGIKKKDKLICPNCNQNLLVNKKFLKLRAKKSDKVEVKKKIILKKEDKDLGIFPNNNNHKHSMDTNKNDDFSDENNEIIFIVKRKKKNNDNIKITSVKEINNNNIYEPQINIKENETNSQKGKAMSISFEENKEKEKEIININIEDDKNKIRKKIYLNNFEMKDNNLMNNLKNSINNNEQRTLFNGNNNNKTNISVGSERDHIISAFAKKEK